MQCSGVVIGPAISLACEGVISPVISPANCSFDDDLTSSSCNNSLSYKGWNVFMLLISLYVGNISEININPLEFTPGDHILTISFVDVNGNTGSFQFNFTGRLRECEFIHIISQELIITWFVLSIMIISSCCGLCSA